MGAYQKKVKMKLNHQLTLLVFFCSLLSGIILSFLFYQDRLQHEQERRLDFIVSIQSSIDVLRERLGGLDLNDANVNWEDAIIANAVLGDVLERKEGFLFSKDLIENLRQKQDEVRRLLLVEKKKADDPSHQPEDLKHAPHFVYLNPLLFSISEDQLRLHHGLLKYLQQFKGSIALSLAFLLVICSFFVSALSFLFRHRFFVGLLAIKEAIQDVKKGNFHGVVKAKYNDELQIIADELSVMKFTLNETMISRDALKLEIEKKTKQLRAKHDELNQLANTDSLTGLLNRRAFEMQVKRSMMQAKRLQRNAALLYIDLDDFKSINDEKGHEAGDLVLIEIASRLRSSVRETDLVARPGGDEFIVWLDLIDTYSNVEVAIERIFKSFDQPIDVKGKKHSVTLSIGVAIFPHHSEHLIELMKKADLAMYKAKLRKSSQGMHICIYNETQET